MKQKSLMSWFAKPTGDSANKAAKSAPAPKLKKSASSSSALSERANKIEKSSQEKMSSSDAAPSSDLRSSPGALNGAKDTPPTSDLVDVEMEFETEKKVPKIKAVSCYLGC